MKYHPALAAAIFGVSYAGVAMADPLLTGLDGTRDSTAFAGKYEGDVLPQDAGVGFNLVDPNLIAGTSNEPASLGSAGGVNYLRIDTDTNARASDAYFWTKDDGGTWDPHDSSIGGYTIELRAIIRPTNSAQYGFAVREIDQNTDGLVQFFNDKIIGPRDTAALGAVPTPPNNDDWHTFRIATYSPDGSSAGQVFQIWRDGVELATVAQNTNFLGEQLWFGDLVSGLAEVNVDIDYLRWDTTGAWAPVPNPGWAINGSGDWNVSGNWVGGVPNGIGSVAILGGVITSPQTVFSNTGITVGTLKFDNANSYMVSGQGSLTLQVASGTATVQVVQGSHAINLPSFFASDANITVANGATLTIGNPATIKANKTVTKTGALAINALLTIETDGVFNLSTGPTRIFGAPTLASGARINVQNNSLTVDYQGQSSPAATIKSQLTSGYNGGAWNAGGINTSSATSATGLGWKDDVAGQSILVKYTYYGDANLDGQVDISDLGALATAWQTSAVWSQGDFDYSGFVDISDLGKLATNWQLGVGSPLGPSFDEALASVGLAGVSVPEPGMVGIFGTLCGLSMWRRRRREPAAPR